MLAGCSGLLLLLFDAGCAGAAALPSSPACRCNVLALQEPGLPQLAREIIRAGAVLRRQRGGGR